ncbi:MAG: lipid-A-disaccharide synthase-related protein [Actinomycetota bacterium]
MKLLCLSNGHGEDAIAVRILQELQQYPHPPELAALPIVGEGAAYAQLPNIPIIGPVQRMPSGGFIYMDGRQFFRDLQGGLLQLTLAQFKTIRAWAKQGGVVLAVGDIVPLLFAWLSGATYAFVGTAKSEYYLRDEAGPLSPKSKGQSWGGWSGSVYLPWERWLMSRRRCQAVFPRDTLTTERLQQFRIPAYDMGNPMIDGLVPEQPAATFYGGDLEWQERQRSLTVTLLPGSRAPEAYANWQLILQAVSGLMEVFWERNLLFLAAIAPALNQEVLRSSLESYGWRLESDATSQGGGSFLPSSITSSAFFQSPLTFTQRKATLVLTQHHFNDCLQQGDFAIAMAGTATEQFVGLGKPAIAIPGSGPQFTPAFAEAQSRLLGPSLILVERSAQVAEAIQTLLRDPDRLQLISDNGKRRIGKPGAAGRIAAHLIELFDGL